MRYYDNLGRLARETTPVGGSGHPLSNGFIFPPPSTSEHRYTYDFLGRVTGDGLYANNSTPTALWSTTTSYSGVWVGVTGPNSGQFTETRNDARGNLAEVREHNGAATYTTLYGYNRANLLTSILDAAGNTTSYGYNQRGLRTSATDGSVRSFV